MSKKYKVTSWGQVGLNNRTDPVTLDRAARLKETYGLHHLSLPQIVGAWENYSDSMSAGWLIDDKESVEEVFNVTLEEDIES